MKESVAIVLECQGAIYGIVRAQDRPAFPGYFSFPGGVCDQGDAELAARMNLRGEWQQPHHAATCARELLEETGIDLSALERAGEKISVQFLGKAVTPEFNPVRFETYYYGVRLQARPAVALCTREFKSGGWALPGEHLQAFLRGEVPMVPVTRWLLEALASGARPPFALNLTYDAEQVVPMIAPVVGVEQFLPRSPTFPPANRTNCFYVGDSGARKILIDPSPLDQAESERLERALGTRVIDAILITHHHPDHHHLALPLAIKRRLPLLMSARTRQLMALKYGADYLQGAAIEIVSEGDVLTTSCGEQVLLLAVPGHDDGQLAPYRADLAWIIAGDLIQTVGTVVIGDVEGDMAKYFASLERVIAMKPRMVFPSHGIVMGGTHQLQVTLKHRREREQQIIQLMRSGADEDAILATVYAGLPERLLYYARKTIQAHVVKIEREQLLTKQTGEL